MKRVSKLLLTFVLVLTLLTGCVKYNVSMEVKDDKSVTLEIIYGMEVDTSLFEEETDTSENEYYEDDIYTDDGYYEDEYYTDDTQTEDDTSVEVEDYKYLEEAGYKVEEFNETKDDVAYAGIKVTKTFANIDDITADKKSEINFNDLFNEEKKDELKNIKFFYKDGSNYVANFVFDFSTEDDGMDLSNYQDMFDLEYKITLPSKSIENNATKVSEDGKTLTWDLDYGKKNNVNFEFALGPDMVMMIIIVVAVVAVVGIIASLIMGKKNKPVNMEPNPTEPVTPVEDNDISSSAMPDLLDDEPAIEEPVMEPIMPDEPAIMAPSTPAMPAVPSVPEDDVPAIDFSSPVAPVTQSAPVQQPVQPVQQPVNAFNAQPQVVQPVQQPVAQVAPVQQVPVQQVPVQQVQPQVVPQAPVVQQVQQPVVPPVDNNNNGVM